MNNRRFGPAPRERRPNAGPAQPDQPAQRGNQPQQRNFDRPQRGQPAGRGQSAQRGGQRNRRPKVLNRYWRDETQKEVAQIAGPQQGKLRVIPLGGVEQVGQNMMLFEYGTDIVIVDMGLQFPDEGMHGIDYLIPDTAYLRGKEKNIRGIVITHGHYDHIGAIPHLMPRLGLNIPIYGTPLTLAIIKKRQEEFPDKLNLHSIKPTDVLRLGQFRVEFFPVNHNIPQSVGVVVSCPIGSVVHTGDWKIDHTPVNDEPIQLDRIAAIGARGVLAAFCDSTNANHEGYQMSESAVLDNLEQVFANAPGRIIVGTFASLLSRIQVVATLCEKHSRRLAVVGRSMTDNVAIAQQLKYFNTKPGTLISEEEALKMSPRHVVMMVTGAQGEKRAGLARIARGEHKTIRIEPTDTVVFSSSIIPGNENTIARLVDDLYRCGAHVINYQMMDIHAGGHAKAEEAKLMVKLLKPKHFIPIEGNHYLLCRHADVIRSMGFPERGIHILDNGQPIEFDRNGVAVEYKERVARNIVAVDGKGVGDVGEVVLKDRQLMASDGIFVTILTVDKESGTLKSNPDILTRGFIYVRGSETLMEGARDMARTSFEQNKGLFPDSIPELRDAIRGDVEKFLFKETEREPMVLPVIIQA